jgi:hypothetical protein
VWRSETYWSRRSCTSTARSFAPPLDGPKITNGTVSHRHD